MGLVAFKERRLDSRRRLTGLLPGRIRYDGRDLSARPIDVSRNGLGILMSDELAPGAELVMLVGDRVIDMRVAWGRKDFGKQSLFRYGLVTVDPAIDLENIFVGCGCVVD